MFEKLKEKRELKKQQEEAKVRAAVRKFLNDATNASCYSHRLGIDSFYKGDTSILNGHTVYTMYFRCNRFGHEVEVYFAESYGPCVASRTYYLGGTDLETFLSEASRGLERACADWKCEYTYSDEKAMRRLYVPDSSEEPYPAASGLIKISSTKPICEFFKRPAKTTTTTYASAQSVYPSSEQQGKINKKHKEEAASQNSYTPTIQSSNKLKYEVNADGSTCTITGIGTCTDKDLEIPSVIDGYKVTAMIFSTTSNAIKF